jgi:hypothetical protein
MEKVSGEYGKGVTGNYSSTAQPRSPNDMLIKQERGRSLTLRRAACLKVTLNAVLRYYARTVAFKSANNALKF